MYIFGSLTWSPTSTCTHTDQINGAKSLFFPVFYKLDPSSNPHMLLSWLPAETFLHFPSPCLLMLAKTEAGHLLSSVDEGRQAASSAALLATRWFYYIVIN